MKKFLSFLAGAILSAVGALACYNAAYAEVVTVNDLTTFKQYCTNGGDIKLGADIDRTQNDFKDEDVPEEEGVVIPPRPPRRIHNPDGTITDPEKENNEKQEQ